MKRPIIRARLTSLALALLLLLASCGTPTTQDASHANASGSDQTSAEPSAGAAKEDDKMETRYTPLNHENIKALWLSQFDLANVYKSDGIQRKQTEFEKLISVILQNAKNDGFNTVIVQVRPYGDSFYPSKFYPTSSYVVGSYGKSALYDPFAIVIEKAHALGLSVHAWINPLRCMTEKEISSVPQAFPLRRFYDNAETRGKYVVTCGDRLYLNPAYEEVRSLITSGAEEIVRLYEVDGVHMDDYFYPTQDASFDSDAYGEYVAGGGTLSLANFRRDALNRLVGDIYAAVKKENEALLFGISPAGNIANVYDKQYADVYTWCASDGYVDYICPQVYFGFEHGSCDFKKTCGIWQDIIKNDSVDLIIGMTLGKALSKEDKYAGSGKNEWAEHSDILLRSLSHTKTLPRCRGVAYFCYQYFYDPISGVSVAATQKERDNFIPILKTATW